MPDPDNIEYAYVCTRHDLYGAPNNGVEHQHDEPVDHRAGFNLHHEPAKHFLLNGEQCRLNHDWHWDRTGDPTHDDGTVCTYYAPERRGARDNGFIFPNSDAGEQRWPFLHPSARLHYLDTVRHLRDW